jgi:hypothetical protein
VNKVKTRPADPQGSPVGCVHYWIVDTAEGERISQGKCKLCGQEKSCRNTFVVDEAYKYGRSRRARGSRDLGDSDGEVETEADD